MQEEQVQNLRQQRGYRIQGQQGSQCERREKVRKDQGKEKKGMTMNI